MKSKTIVRLLATCALAAGLAACGGRSSGSGSAAEAVPLAPASVVTTPSDQKVTINWAPSPGAKTYNVYQSVSRGAASSSPVATWLTSTSATISGLNNAAEYFFSVRAVNDVGVSPLSEEVSATPQAPIVANGNLADGVRVLTDTENSSVVSETDTTVLINGSFKIDPGTVFLTANGAYVADSIGASGGQTQINVHLPQIDDVFSKLVIKGTFPITSDTNTITPASVAPSGIARSRASATTTSPTCELETKINPPLNSYNLTGSVKCDFGSSVTIEGEFTTRIVTNYDFQYDKAAQGVTKANFTADLSQEIKFTASAFKVKASYDQPLFTASFPISVSLFDSLLNFVGIRVATIAVPVSLSLEVENKFKLSPSLTFSSGGRVSVLYTPDSGASIDSMLKPADVIATLTDITPEPSSALVIPTSEGKLSLRIRPLLKILNRVELVGVDINGGGYVDSEIKTVSGTPPFCLRGSDGYFLEVFGFIKAVTSDIKTNKVSYKSAPNKLKPVGNCTVSTVVNATVSPSSLPATYGGPLSVSVSVSPEYPADAVGLDPGGAAIIQFGVNSCQVTLDSSGKGNCSLAADSAGIGETIFASYGGDDNFDPSGSQTQVDVQKSPTTTALSVTSTSLVTNVPITFSVTASPNPSNKELPPSGQFRIVDQTGKTICTSQFGQVSTNQCSASFAKVGTYRLTARYEGDLNYLPSMSGNINLVIDGAFAFEVAESDPGSSAGVPRYSCKTFSGEVYGRGGVTGSFDLCSSNLGAVARCVGTACESGRFFASIFKSDVTQNYIVVKPGDASCPPPATGPFINDPGGNQLQVYSAGSPYWIGLSTDWIKPWPSVSRVTPNQPFALNSAITSDTSTDPAPICTVNSLVHDLSVRIYDKQLDKYQDLSLTVLLPGTGP